MNMYPPAIEENMNDLYRGAETTHHDASLAADIND